MKKLVTGILAMLLCFGCLAGCGDNADTSSSTPDASTPNASTPDTSTPDTSTPDTPADPAHPHEVDLADVKDYVFEQMSKKNLETRESFTVINTFSFIGAEEKYDIAWSLDVTEGVTITEGETEDTVVIAALDEDLPFTLTATITDPEGCHTTSFSLDCLAKAMPQIVPLAITEKPAENTAYKLYVYQSTLAKDLYFNGYDKAATYYFGTTENYEEAVDIYVEYIEGTDNFNLTFTYEDVKKYIGVRLSDDGAHDNIVATTEPVSSFFWSEELGTVLTHLDKNKNGEAADYYLGNYSTKDTISLSMTSYAGGAGNNVGGLVTMVDKSTIVIPDDKKVSDVKDALSVATAHTLDKTVELTTSDDRYPEVSIVWAVEEGKGASVTADGLVLAIPAEATTAVLTATVSCGEVTETKEFTLELGPKTVAPDKTNADAIVEAAFNLAAGEVLPGDNYTLTGVIKNVKTAYNPEHSNVTVVITVGDKEIECYRLKGEGADVIKAGDTITVTGILKNYNGTVEFDKDCSLDSYVAATPEEPGDTPVVGETKTISLTIDSMGLPVETAYSTDTKTATVADIEFGYIQIGSYGNGLQWRTKNGASGTLWNNTAIAGNITKIVFTHNAAKKTYDGNNYTIAFGTTADCADKTVTASTSASSNQVVVEVDGAYSFFKITHANTYTQYWDSIEISYTEVKQEAPTEAGSISLTIDNMGLPVETAYSTDTKTTTVADIEFGYIQIGSYGNGLQWRTKNGASGTLWNNTAIAGNITKIVFTHNAAKKTYDGNNYTIAFGTTADCADKTVTASTSASSNQIVVEVDGNYTFFKITHANTYTQYWDSIEIFYE